MTQDYIRRKKRNKTFSSYIIGKSHKWNSYIDIYIHTHVYKYKYVYMYMYIYK